VVERVVSDAAQPVDPAWTVLRPIDEGLYSHRLSRTSPTRVGPTLA
jgi:hypothetical protein